MPHILIYRLQSKRRTLEAEIRRELKRRLPDFKRIGELQARKAELRTQLLALQPA